MNKLPTITILFANEIDAHEVVPFRGAVIASLRQKDILFHNHGDGQRLRYAYPLIQYKQLHRRAAVVGIGKGIEAISQLLTLGSHDLKIGRRTVAMQIEAVDARDNEVSLTDEATQHYRLHNWLPLNSRNYEAYQAAADLAERVAILERVLTGNILSMLKGVGIFLDNQLEVHITDICAQRPTVYKQVRLMAFDVEFRANITLPQHIGLGKNASVGCGVLSRITN